ncbi:hypothetical protein HYU07_06005 [Candidatus Woesearchaeota archaeon]|nr:hypothetical protein [Candidatus Woesearchaeota archaeon]
MDGNRLLDEYMCYLRRLKDGLNLNDVFYARKTRHELRFKELQFNIPLLAEGKNRKDFIRLENGEIFYYEIRQLDNTFIAILCRKSSESNNPGKSSRYNDVKTYRAITNSENPEKINPFLFKNPKILTIDDAIKRIELLRR